MSLSRRWARFRNRGVWADPVRRVRTLESFAETEEDGGKDLLAASRRILDADLRHHIERHADDEVRHATIFRSLAAELRKDTSLAAVRSEEVDRAFDEIARDVGAYDVLFNHAGTIIVKPLHESTEEDYDRLMDINVRSAFFVCRRALPEMVANGGGSVVITASIASELGYALGSLYCFMSKGAVL